MPKLFIEPPAPPPPAFEQAAEILGAWQENDTGRWFISARLELSESEMICLAAFARHRGLTVDPVGDLDAFSTIYR